MNARSKGAAIARLKRQQRKDPKRIISLLLVISMLCGNFMLLPSSAAEMVAYCGKEEHTHSDACYLIEETPAATEAAGETETTAAAETTAAETEAPATTEAAAAEAEETTNASADSRVQLLSDMDSAETLGAASEEETQAAETEAAVEGSKTAETLAAASNVTVSETPVCGKEVHVHTLQCYSNPNADVETAAIWEATLPEKLSGDWGKDLAEVAKSQLGYAESAANYLVGADGETLMGYSRYGAWYSSYTQDEKQAYADWNVPFLFFCLYYAGVEDFPIEEDCADWTAALAAAELWREAAGEYIPEAGDLVFLDTDEDGAADRAAVVTDWDEAKVTAVESDSEGAVKTVTYDLTEDTQVLGYGDTNEAQEKVEVSDSGEAPELFGFLSQTKVVYLNVSNITWWSDASAEMRLFYKPTGSDSWKYSAAAEATGTANLLKITVSDLDISGSSDFHVKRVGPGTVTTGSTSEGNAWNSWQDINADDSKNQLMLYKSDNNHTYSWSDEWIETDNSGGGGGGGTTSGSLQAGDTLYLDFSQHTAWGDNGAKFGLYYNNGSKVDMTQVSTYVYSVTIPSGMSGSFRIFRRNPNGSVNDAEWWDATDDLTLPTDGSNCYFITSAGSTNTGTNNGHWGTYSSGGGGGNNENIGTTDGKVDLNVVNHFNPNTNALYVQSTFYDYYTDWEREGKNQDDNTSGFVKGDDWVTFTGFNKTLSSYYSSNSVEIPIYVGHFQPDWSDNNGAWGWQYKDLVNSNRDKYYLYGFMDGNAYGSGGITDQKYFMSVNNSNMNLNPSIGYVDAAAQGLVFDSLSGGNLMSETENGGQVYMPLFNANYITNNNLGAVYNNVSFPFKKIDENNDGVYYWTFDSSKTTLEMKKDNSTQGYFLDDVGLQDWSKNLDSASAYTNGYGFFPFNEGSTPGNADTYNYGFGCRLDIPFRLTSDGKVSTDNGGETDIIFEFSGDDDVWVFIDGVLALDIGGAHGKVTGTLNFNKDKMSATVSRTKTNPGSSTEGNNVSRQFTLNGDHTSQHTLTMFYMERGMWESNMKITFNFPEENILVVEKDLNTDNVNDLFEGYFANAQFDFNIKNLATHYGTQNSTPSNTGFQTPQDSIRDWGSADTGTLQIPNGATYTLEKADNTTSAGTIGSNGKFTLKDGESVTFNDQFRRGSYIYLEETFPNTTDADDQNLYKQLYKTVWTMYEDDVPVSYFRTGNTVTNPSSYDMTSVESYAVDDGRMENYDSTIGNSGYTDTRDPGNVFVFRSYKNPDSTTSTTKLTAKFTNTVRTGTLTLSKVRDGDESLGTEKFKFYIVFTDVGGLDLEGSDSIVKEVELTAGESTTITGIPVNTTYTIYEKDPTDTTISLSKVTVQNGNATADETTITDTTYNNADAKSITGKIALSGTSGETDTVTFYNTKSAKTSLTLTKNWTFADGKTFLNDVELLPTSITVQLQRKAKNVDNATWADVGGPVTINATSDTDTKPPYSWTYTFSELDKTGTYMNETVEWEYQVIESKVGDGVVTDGAADDFRVIRGAVTTKEDDGSFEQTITNAYDPKVDISVTKSWPNANSTDIPGSIWVTIQRRTSDTAEWETLSQSAELAPSDTENKNWKHTFRDLPKYTPAGVEYQYRVVELTGTGENQTAVANDGYIVHDGRLFKVTYSNPNLAGSNAPDTTKWTITNTVQTVNLEITKQSSVAENGVKLTLDGAVFKLEKMTDSSYETLERVIATDVKTQSGGKASFTGLSEGYYLLTETQAAAGYSLLASPIKIVITANVNGTFMIKVDNGTEQTVHADSNGTYAYGLTVYNKPQLVMPATGGVGGFEFWILGGLCFIAVPLLLYTFTWYKKGGKYRRD